MKNTLLILAIFCLLPSCIGHSNLKYEKALPELLSEDLMTTMPGKLIVADQFLVWEDPFARDYFVHVHDKMSGNAVGSMGAVGEGPEEFITGGISFSCIDNRFFATDANGNTKGYLSLDSLIDQRKAFIPLTAHEKESRPSMGEWEEGVFVGMTEDGDASYCKANIQGQESTFGVYPISEIKQHLGGDKAYDAVDGLFLYSSYSIPYLALYKKIGNTFLLQWEVHPDIKTYEISADKIIFDRKIQGIRGVCMSKDFIITLQRDQSIDPMDESTVGRDASKCPHTVFLYDYEGHLIKIVDLNMPIMRIAADRTSNVLYAIGANPEFVLVKYEL